MSEHADLLTGLHAEPGMHEREWQVVNATGHRICYVQAFSEDEAIYLARSIVHAVNSHEELLEACEAAMDFVGVQPESHEGLGLYATLKEIIGKARDE